VAARPVLHAVEAGMTRWPKPMAAHRRRRRRRRWHGARRLLALPLADREAMARALAFVLAQPVVPCRRRFLAACQAVLQAE
jgi:hypothetical protein